MLCVAVNGTGERRLTLLLDEDVVDVERTDDAELLFSL
jgi:hypothetical protein